VWCEVHCSKKHNYLLFLHVILPPACDFCNFSRNHIMASSLFPAGNSSPTYMREALTHEFPEVVNGVFPFGAVCVPRTRSTIEIRPTPLP
jgi:hypothetical protein